MIQQVLAGNLVARLDAWFNAPNRPMDDIVWGLVVVGATMLLGGFIAYYFRRKGSTESFFTIEDSGGAFIAGAVAAFTGVSILTAFAPAGTA